MTSSRPVVVFGVIGNDIHVVANRVLHLCLEHRGFHAVNLGTNNMPEDFADAALETDARAVLISSLNGEAAHWCRDLRPIFEERGLAGIVIYLGGNLVTGVHAARSVQQTFLDYGIDRAFHGATDFDEILGLLHQDLAHG